MLLSRLISVFELIERPKLKNIVAKVDILKRYPSTPTASGPKVKIASFIRAKDTEIATNAATPNKIVVHAERTLAL